LSAHPDPLATIGGCLLLKGSEGEKGRKEIGRGRDEEEGREGEEKEGRERTTCIPHYFRS